MRLEELLGHRRRDARAPAARQRRQDHRHVQVALMVRGEHDRPVEIASRCSRPSTRIYANTRASGRIQVACDSRRISRTGQRAVPRREVDRLVDLGVCGAACSTSALADRRASARLGEARLVDARLEPILERHHQLDALERAEAQLLERVSRRRPARPRANRASSASSGSPPLRGAAAAAPVATQSRIAAPLQLPRAFGARQLAAGPDRDAADALMILQPRVGVADDALRRRRPARAPAPRARAPVAPSATPTTADSRTPGCALSTRSTSSGKTFSPSGVTIISFLRPLMNTGPARRARRCRRCAASRPSSSVRLG